MIHSSHGAVALPLLVSIFRNDLCAAFSSPTRQPRRSLSHHMSDYAGYHATYDIDGTHIPVPEFYVPQALLDWGQAPLALEVVVSENEVRHVLTVLPETGCGLDNLEVLQRHETLGTPLWETNEIIAACVYVTPETSRVECVFALQQPDHRSRVVLNCDLQTGSLKNLFLCRRADGGGLDARSVSGWIGPELRAMENSLNQKCIPRDLGTLEGNAKHTFGLPGSVTVAFDRDEKDLTLWISQACFDQCRWIELKCRNRKWEARSWLGTITS